jgi:ParB/RepB/Spo0J family partition protein
MDVQLIQCTLIDIPPTNPYRTFKREFAMELSESIRLEGMWNAIVLRPNPITPDRYMLVQGRYRLHAKKDVLKDTHIAARVFVDMDDADAKMAMITENLWRTPLSKGQRLKATKRWWEHYARKHPGRVGKGRAGGAATKRKAEAKRAGGGARSTRSKVDGSVAKLDPVRAAEASEGSQSGSTSEAQTSFAEQFSAVSGKSLATSKRDIRIATMFTDEQLETFDNLGISQTDMLTISKIKDESKRNAVVDLLGFVPEPMDALREVMKDQAPAREDGRSKVAREAEATAEREAEPSFSDDEWFKINCGELVGLLKNSDRYKAEAIFYRNIAEPRHLFRSGVKKHIPEVKEGSLPGGLLDCVNKLISVSHPKDWCLCKKCKGSGESKGNARCASCSGCGFKVTSGNYP